MKILFAEDQNLFVKMFVNLLPEVESKLGEKIELIGTATNGKELVALYHQHSAAGIDAIFSDIRMPEMDGLSALVTIQKESVYRQKFYMVSSENLKDLEVLNREHGRASVEDLNFASKFEMVNKVADRIRNNVTEPGKTNSILTACEIVEADPIRVASRFGANGYLLKPYNAERLLRLFQHVRGGSGFCNAA